MGLQEGRHSASSAVPFSSEHEGPQVKEDAPVPVTPALGRLGRFATNSVPASAV